MSKSKATYRFTKSQRTNLLRYIAELRTTTLAQGTQYYRRDDCYCALGILYNMEDSTAWCLTPTWTTPYYTWIGPPMLNIAKKYGLMHNLDALISMYNDARLYSFARIADILEHVLCTGELPHGNTAYMLMPVVLATQSK